MTRPQFVWEFNLGHILQAGATLIAITAGWVVLDSRSQANALAIAAVNDQTREMGLRLHALELQVARADERYSAILDMLARIDTRLDRIEQSR